MDSNTIYFILQQMLYFSIPLLIVALGGMFSERSGVVNIALEGIMLFGGFFGIITINIIQYHLPKSNFLTQLNPQFIVIIGLLIAGLFGLLFALFHAYASVNMKADQVISGTALNMFAPAFAIYLARSLSITGHTQQVPFTSSFLIKNVPILSKIPILGDIIFKQVFITTYIGFLILIISYIVIYKTPFGLRLRSCGEYPQASDAAGINVYHMRYFGVAISGFLGGIGGYIFILTTSTRYDATVAGYGFLALAVLIFGQWKPMRILAAAIFFGFMKTLASAYTGIDFLANLHISGYIYKMIPFIMTLVVLSYTSAKTQGPKAAGEVFDAGKR